MARKALTTTVANHTWPKGLPSGQKRYSRIRTKQWGDRWNVCCLKMREACLQQRAVLILRIWHSRWDRSLLMELCGGSMRWKSIQRAMLKTTSLKCFEIRKRACGSDNIIAYNICSKYGLIKPSHLSPNSPSHASLMHTRICDNIFFRAL